MDQKFNWVGFISFKNICPTEGKSSSSKVSAEQSQGEQHKKIKQSLISFCCLRAEGATQTQDFHKDFSQDLFYSTVLLQCYHAHWVTLPNFICLYYEFHQSHNSIILHDFMFCECTHVYQTKDLCLCQDLSGFELLMLLQMYNYAFFLT